VIIVRRTKTKSLNSPDKKNNSKSNGILLRVWRNILERRKPEQECQKERRFRGKGKSIRKYLWRMRGSRDPTRETILLYDGEKIRQGGTFSLSDRGETIESEQGGEGGLRKKINRCSSLHRRSAIWLIVVGRWGRGKPGLGKGLTDYNLREVESDLVRTADNREK